MRLMYQSKEAFINCFSDHFPPRNQFSVQLVKYVLQVISFDGLFRVKKLEKLLDELWGDVDFQLLGVDCFVDD